MSRKAPAISVPVSEYRGVAVRIDGNTRSLSFCATYANQSFSGPSWESITKKLDAAMGFPARDLVLDEREAPRRVRVVGVEKNSFSGDRFILEGGEALKYGSLYKLEAEPLLIERRRLANEAEDIASGYQQKIDDLNEQINPLYVRVGD